MQFSRLMIPDPAVGCAWDDARLGNGNLVQFRKELLPSHLVLGLYCRRLSVGET
jgi:hypothetical protein